MYTSFGLSPGITDVNRIHKNSGDVQEVVSSSGLSSLKWTAAARPKFMNNLYEHLLTSLLKMKTVFRSNLELHFRKNGWILKRSAKPLGNDEGQCTEQDCCLDVVYNIKYDWM